MTNSSTSIVATAATASPVYAKVVEELNASGFSLVDMPLTDLRAFCNMPVPLPEGIEMPQVAPVEEKIITTTAENGTGSVTLKIVRPKGSENETLPVAVFLHGGGWVLGSYTITEKFIKDVVVVANSVVIYVEYSLSPEVKYPVAMEESYSVIMWVYQNAASINVNPTKISVFGDSAGGNLSAVVSILLKRRGHGNLLKNQILLYPAVAYNHSQYESFHLYGKGNYILSSAEMEYFRKLHHDPRHTTRNEDGRFNHGPEDVLSAPLLATKEELEGLPRCLVITAECDVLRDEGEQYARQLTTAGVDTLAVRFLGAMHGFMTRTDLYTSQYRQGLQTIADYLKNDSL